MGGLDGQTVLVVGGNGFLGRHLVVRLIQAGANVHVISRSLPSDNGNVRWWTGNVAEFPCVRDLMFQVKPDVVYQLASASMGGQDPELVLATFENDLRTTVNVLLAARDSGCGRVIITRSLDEPNSNGSAQIPYSPYAAAKAASGLYGRMFHHLYRVPVVMLRPFMTYGPGQKDHKVIPYTIQSMLKGETPAIGSGNRRVDWIYVDDVITGFLAAGSRPEAVGMEIDLGSGTLVTVGEVVEQIGELIPKAPPPRFLSVPDRICEPTRLADLKAAKETLDWHPVTSLREGLSRTIEWYRRRGAR